mgnify:CR=1 FL=1
MPEPTAPDPDDNRSDEHSSGDITESPYTRDRSARDEEVGRTPTPQELAEIRRRTQEARPQAPPVQPTAPAEPDEEPYVPLSPEQDEEVKKRIKLNKIKLNLPSKFDKTSRRTVEHDSIADAIDSYMDDKELTEDQQAIIDKLLSE